MLYYLRLLQFRKRESLSNYTKRVPWALKPYLGDLIFRRYILLLDSFATKKKSHKKKSRFFLYLIHWLFIIHTYNQLLRATLSSDRDWRTKRRKARLDIPRQHRILRNRYWGSGLFVRPEHAGVESLITNVTEWRNILAKKRLSVKKQRRANFLRFRDLWEEQQITKATGEEKKRKRYTWMQFGTGHMFRPVCSFGLRFWRQRFRPVAWSIRKKGRYFNLLNLTTIKQHRQHFLRSMSTLKGKSRHYDRGSRQKLYSSAIWLLRCMSVYMSFYSYLSDYDYFIIRSLIKRPVLEGIKLFSPYDPYFKTKKLFVVFRMFKLRLQYFSSDNVTEIAFLRERWKKWLQKPYFEIERPQEHPLNTWKRKSKEFHERRRKKKKKLQYQNQKTQKPFWSFSMRRPWLQLRRREAKKIPYSLRHFEVQDKIRSVVMMPIPFGIHLPLFLDRSLFWRRLVLEFFVYYRGKRI